MDRSAPKAIRNWMGRFADTDGLIVDVRDNGGGSRAALLELAGYLMTPDQAPQVANACKYRLFKEFDEDHLESRFAYRAASTRFDKREKKAIKDFKQSFRPEWEPNEADFSDWHYLVLSKRADDARPFYGKSVVILMNEKCFSATDIFLGAFKGWPNVTLVGQPSGGGSARSEEFQLPISEIEISCASMASFQPNGKLYDTNGIEPDVLVEPTPDYFIRGGSDPFLEKAMELLANETVGDHTHLTDVSAKYRERRDYVPPPKGLSPRQTVDGFLCELAAGKKDNNGIKGSSQHLWAYTTRKRGWGLTMERLAKLAGFRATAQMGNESQMLILTGTGTDNGKAKVGVFDLVKRDGQWLIEKMELYSPDKAWAFTGGFVRNPDIDWVILPQDLVGNFSWGVPFVPYQETHFKEDGSFVRRSRPYKKAEVTTTQGKWQLKGNVLTTTIGQKSIATEVVGLFNDGTFEGFEVRPKSTSDGGGIVRYIREKQSRFDK